MKNKLTIEAVHPFFISYFSFTQSPPQSTISTVLVFIEDLFGSIILFPALKVASEATVVTGTVRISFANLLRTGYLASFPIHQVKTSNLALGETFKGGSSKYNSRSVLELLPTTVSKNISKFLLPNPEVDPTSGDSDAA